MQGEAAENLQGFLASGDNHVTCQAQATADFVRLMSDGTDAAQAALINGAARVKDDAPEAYRDQQAAAQAGAARHLGEPTAAAGDDHPPDSAGHRDAARR